MKVKIIEKCEVKRTYEIEVANVGTDEEPEINTDEVYGKLYSGDYDPDFEEEYNNEVTLYDENDNVLDG